MRLVVASAAIAAALLFVAVDADAQEKREPVATLVVTQAEAPDDLVAVRDGTTATRDDSDSSECDVTEGSLLPPSWCDFNWYTYIHFGYP